MVPRGALSCRNRGSLLPPSSVAFSVFKGSGQLRERSDQHQLQHRLVDKRNKLNLIVFKCIQVHHTFFTDDY